MLGEFADSLIFVCGSLGWVLLSVSLFAYVGYCILIVVTDTAAGVDRVVWPADSMIDWIGQSVRFFVFFVTLLVPVAAALATFGKAVLPDDPPGRVVVFVGTWYWLTFPVALLSSMSAGHPFALVKPVVVVNLLRIGPTLIGFYVVTGLGALEVVLLWNQVMYGGQFWLLPLAAIVTAGGVLIYARLIGRLGGITAGLIPWERQKPLPKRKTKQRKKVKVSDPWALPDEESEEARPLYRAKLIPEPETPKKVDEEDEWGPATPYGISGDPAAKPPQLELIEGTYYLDVKVAPERSSTPEIPPPPARFEDHFDDDDNPGAIQFLPDKQEAIRDRPTLEVTPSTLDMRLARQHPATSDGPAGLLSGVFAFPFYKTSLRAMFVISFSSIALALGLYAIIWFKPR